MHPMHLIQLTFHLLKIYQMMDQVIILVIKLLMIHQMQQIIKKIVQLKAIQLQVIQLEAIQLEVIQLEVIQVIVIQLEAI